MKAQRRSGRVCEHCGNEIVTDQAVADVMGVSREMVRQWRTGRTACPDEYIPKIVEMIGRFHHIKASSESDQKSALRGREEEFVRIWNTGMKRTDMGVLFDVGTNTISAWARKLKLKPRSAGRRCGTAKTSTFTASAKKDITKMRALGVSYKEIGRVMEIHPMTARAWERR